MTPRRQAWAVFLVVGIDYGSHGADTSGCPRPGQRCECCGDDPPGVAVVAVCLPLGWACVTACCSCAVALGRGSPLPVTAATAERLVAQHQRHLRARS